MKTYGLRTQHSSLQFSDGPRAQKNDVEKLFKQGQDFPIKTGTESGPERGNDNREFLQEFAEKYNHLINFGGDCWVAVDRDIIKRGTVERGDLFLVSQDQVVGSGNDRIMPWIGFEHVKPGVGRVNQGAVHYPTGGAKPGSPNHDANMICSMKIANWMEYTADGSSMAFLNGDFNINDRILDVALGKNFTTMADELRRHQDTGHGPIDAMCSFDKDGRVSAGWFNVLDDKEMYLFTDHYLCRGAWDIRLKEAA